MSTRSKTRVATFVLLVVLTSGIAAAPKREDPQAGFFSRLGQIVNHIRKIFLPTPFDDPSFPKP
ncbi:MAG TPA: hypothetical protein VGQ65_21330 [Thermoanaerobaculia bacterium]|jgi:hypothetical protein|nr:hypothetical protein [Thermoanaerobaculia bacterium]